MFKFAFFLSTLNNLQEVYLECVWIFFRRYVLSVSKFFFYRKSVFSSKITLILGNSFNNWIVESALDLFALVNFLLLLSCN